MKKINETTFTSDNGLIKFIHGDCTLLMKDIESNSIDVILTDPPYKYLKNQKLEVDFDETIFFDEVKRVLKPDGFIVLFGRGTSFYRWNYMLSELGFIFKEEIIWDKSHCTSPLMAISRVHETISIHTKKNGTINKVKIPYLEMKGNDIAAIITDIKRLKTIFNHAKSMKAVLDFLENNIRDKSESREANNLSISSSITTENRYVSVARSIKLGLNEKSIIKQIRDHYTAIHPTQKPVRLLERLLNLVAKKECVVLDPFAGSFSTAEACKNLNFKFKGIELDKEYFDAAVNRFKIYEQQLTLF